MKKPIGLTNVKPSILIVDDIPDSLELLYELFAQRGYDTRTAISGPEALDMVRKNPPDLILLDVNMPEMNGYEVCEQLKADPDLKDIPILFISAMSETMDKVKAFRVGGVDYVTKPFYVEEVEGRIQTHLRLRRQTRQLQESFNQSRELEQLRDKLTGMIVHDMRSPLSTILASLDLLKHRLPPQDTTSAKLVLTAHRSAAMVMEMSRQLLDVSRLENGQMPLSKTDCDLAVIARDVVDCFLPLARTRQLLLQVSETVIAVCDEDVLRRILGNLLGNAIKFTPANGEVKIAIARKDDKAHIAVTDNGPGIPPQFHKKIFEKFGQVEGDRKKLGSGLGLTFCLLAVEAQGGRIGVESVEGQGSTFWFTLPARC